MRVVGLLFSALLSGAFAQVAAAADLRVYPPEVNISGPGSTQQLLVVEEENGRTVRDVTATAKFTTQKGKSGPVVSVGSKGLITAVDGGDFVITVAVGEKSIKVTGGVGTRKAEEVSFRNQVIPTLTRAGCNAGACHGALAGKGGLKLSLRGFDPESDWFVLTRQAVGRRVDLTKPEDSLALKKATRAVPHGGGTRFNEDSPHYKVMLDWLKAGAPGPKADDATLERLDVFPPAILVQPKNAKDTFRLVVRAVYSDGSAEDVTQLTRFGSSEELVARVSEDGVITPSGNGEAAITIGFGTKVATLTVTAPFPNDVKTDAFAKSPRNNFVDDFVLAKLKLLNLPPSGQCTDEEFIRRAYLDTCGILPTPDEVNAFLADTDAKKRAKLIDKLLDHPAFVDYWSHKWSDVLLVSSRKLPQPAMWAFYRKIRQSVADNQPWDAFARDILTVRLAVRSPTGPATTSCCTRTSALWPRQHRSPSSGCPSGAPSVTTTRWRNGHRTNTGPMRISSRASALKTASEPGRYSCRASTRAMHSICVVESHSTLPRSTVSRSRSIRPSTAACTSRTGSLHRTTHTSRRPS